jgi:exopolyphosphatase/guanosine-5'-triphosphate,3'-diphosphate pyrophosphatase
MHPCVMGGERLTFTAAVGEPGSPRGRDGAAVGGVYAALDLGTNNCRLLVARPAADGFRVIDAFSRIVRLGEGLGRSGYLSEAAMARTIQALRICAGKIRQRGVTQARTVATEACRRASNCGAFLNRVYRETGLNLEIISNDEEASLAVRGCAPLLDPGPTHALVFDIGGGSTELGWMKAPPRRQAGNGADVPAAMPEVGGWHSIPIGVVTLAERHGGHQVTPRVYETMIGEVSEALAPCEAEHRLGELVADGRLQMLGTSGTVTTLAGVHQDLPRYDRARIDGCYLDFETVRRISRRIAAMSYQRRAAHPCIGRDRADLVIAGCAILEAVCGTWPVGRLRVADRGLREGILLTMMPPPKSVAMQRV